MRTLLFRTLCSVLLVAGFGFVAKAVTTISISGSGAACRYAQTNFSVTPTPGITYTWSVAPPSTSTSPTNGAVSVVWNGLGSQALSVTGRDASGTIQESGTIAVSVAPLPSPAIVTTYRVGCNSLAEKDSVFELRTIKTYSTLDDTKGCIKVCDGSVVTYRAFGDTTGTISWAVTGGTILSGQGTTHLVVQWGAAPALGSIALTETSLAGCTATKNLCIEIIEKPDAAFALLPNLSPQSNVDACMNNPVVFKDLSTAGAGSPIVGWLWDFGDGSATSVQHPNVSHTYNNPGTYTAYLVVTNACGCTDTFFTDVNVINEPGPDIICASVVCQNDTAHYHTTNGCGSYNWTVSGGNIIGGWGTQDIVVKWDAVGPDGYGYVSLNSGCGMCTGSTTIKIPVVQATPSVSGPLVMCSNKPYLHAVPLWPGTQYTWGVVNNPGAVIGGRNSNVVSLEFPGPGTYTVHISYQNALRLCGGDLLYDVTVTDPELIQGDTIACKDAPAAHYYSLSGGSSAAWSLARPDGTFQTGSGSGFNATFPISGVYTLSAVVPGACTPEPIRIEVTDFPVTVDNIDGPVTVCPGAPYIYTAGVAVSGTHFEWSVTSGTPGFSATITPPTGNQATVTFNYSGPGQPPAGTTWQLHVKRVSNTPPYCESPDMVLNVVPIVVTPNVLGPTTVCANSTTPYSAKYPGADNYVWKIIPSTLGSVVSGNFANNMSVLWHNSPGTAMIEVAVTRCNITVKDTLFNVVINPAPLVALSPNPASVCEGQSITFTATPGAASYTWNYGDGSAAVTFASNTATYTYLTPTTLGTLPVTVTANGIAGACAPTGTATVPLTVLPAPIAHITCPTGSQYCIGVPYTATLTATNTGSVTSPSYLWSTSTTGPTLSVSSPGAYSVTITDPSTSCSSTATYAIAEIDCTNPGGGSCVGTPAITSLTQQCGVITGTASVSAGGTNPVWSVKSPGSPVAGPTGANTLSYSVTYDKPGTYIVGFSAEFPQPGGGTCRVYAPDMSVVVPLIPDFRPSWQCPTSSSGYVLTLKDHSSLDPSFTNTVSWTVRAGSSVGTIVATGSGSPFSPAIGGGVYWVEMVAVATDGTTSETCSIAKTITMPTPITSASINATYNGNPVTSICEGIPVDFTLTTTPSGALAGGSTVWNYGDGSANANVYPGHRNYTWPLGSGTPNFYVVTANYTDAVGCPGNTTFSLGVYPNTLQGNITGSSVSCSGTPITLGYNATSTGVAPYAYSWSSGGNSVSESVNATGQYNVTVLDNQSCRFKTNDHYTTFVSLTPPQISGLTDYCVGDVVRLYGSIGQNSNYTYDWFRNSTYVGSGPAIADIGLVAGTYSYDLRVTFADPVTSLSCTVWSGTFVATVHGKPVPPFISGPSVISCQPYVLQLNAGHSSGATQTYTWSNGGAGQQDIINTGGPFRVWYTDSYGCTSHRDISVPYAPESYFDWFPSGCYSVCSKQLPLAMYGPPGVFAGWGWLESGGYQSTGSNSAVGPLSINTATTYQLELNNGLCTNVTDPMSVNLINCDNCPPMPMHGTVVCDPMVPNGYMVNLNMNVFMPNTTMTIGTDIGPATPFSAFFPSPGPQLVSLSFTTLTTPPPSTVTIRIRYSSNGRECYDEVTLPLPGCGWPAQRLAKPAPGVGETVLPKSMLVYPNPAVSTVNVGYNFGSQNESRNEIVIYDLTGKRVFAQVVTSGQGTLAVPVTNLAAAVYIVRMEENGKAVQSQRLSLTH